MKQVKYYRKGRTIRTASGDTHYASINEAKRVSAQLQRADGLGCGTLKVITGKLPTLQP